MNKEENYYGLQTIGEFNLPLRQLFSKLAKETREKRLKEEKIWGKPRSKYHR